MQTASHTAPNSSQIDTIEVSDLLRLLEQKDQFIEQQKLLKLMQEKLRLARQKRFGASSEKLPFQSDFFDEAELEVALGDLEQQIQEQEKSKSKRKPRERVL
ncbi:MAG: transposase [Candidatus Thiodiazotropha sp.]